MVYMYSSLVPPKSVVYMPLTTASYGVRAGVYMHRESVIALRSQIFVYSDYSSKGIYTVDPIVLVNKP